MVSMVKAREAGVVSAVPAALSARTSKVCAPGASAAVVNGEAQVANWRAVDAALERRPRRSDPVNVKVGVVSLVGPDGPAVIVVSSAATVKVRVAGGAPGNAPSRTENVYVPFASPVYGWALDL